MYGAMRFWLDRGVDGFRMDVLWLLIKDEQFRDNPPNPDYHPGLHDNARTLPMHNADQPGTHEIVREMRELMDGYGPTLVSRGREAGGEKADPSAALRDDKAIAADDKAGARVSHRVLIGEIYLPLAELVQYYNARKPQTGGVEGISPQVPELEGANLPFNFHLILAQWTAPSIADVVTRYEALLPPGAWPNYVLGNHDQPRLASRIGAKQARAAAMLLLTLRGTPTLYYGDELGMEDVPIAPEEVQDPAEKNEPGKGRGRDPERSPMLWVNAPNAGFTTPEAKPWLPLQQDWATENAAAQRGRPRSMLNLYRSLLALRREHPALYQGAIGDVAAEAAVLRYQRSHEGKRFQVLLNLGGEPAVTRCEPGRVVLTTLLDGEGAAVDGDVTVEGGEGLLIALD